MITAEMRSNILLENLMKDISVLTQQITELKKEIEQLKESLHEDYFK